MNNYDKEQQISEWLKEYNFYKAGIENLKQSIEDIAEEGISVSFSEEVRGGTNKFHSTVEDAAIKIDRLKINRKIKVMANIVSNIDKALDSLNELERTVVTNRCINGEYYYQFCHKIGASERTAKRIKKEAIKKMSIVIFGID